ncbi:hypothetical protein M514_20876 [Trichuris suis]|uniref:Reverse transcriptase domain-containing protein n=1 Tax=Trichuris suis TaxID=68888 RepID=A0A085NC14_9BILA|nr:hypothetical protein M514_20876 [Trichuris suis]
MPFGLRNAAQTFQRFTDEVTPGLDDCFVYVDDVLLASDSEDEHLLQKLFQRFKAYGVRINPAKCTLTAQSLTFLGHQIDKDGVSPSPDEVEAIRVFPTATTTKQLRQFLGTINFYRCFLPNIAVTLASLDALVSPQCQQITLSPSQLEAFETAIALSNATLLQHPVPSAPLALFRRK